MNKRINWIDSAKGIGILLVVYGHVILGLHDAKIGFQSNNYFVQHSIIYTVHMPLFFFLSGLFLKKWIEKSTKEAIGGKIRALLVPYFIWGGIQGLIMQFFSKITNTGQGIIDVVKLPVKPYAQFWFLYVLFFMFIMYYIFVKIFKLRDNIILIIAILMFLISPFINFWQLERITYHFIFFILATFSYQKILKNTTWIVSVVMFLLTNLIMYELNVSDYLKQWFSFIVAISGIVLIVKICEELKKDKLLSYLGKKSLQIYLMHIFATAGSRIILIKVGITNPSIHLVLGIVLGIILPLLAVFIFKKIKIDRYLF